ncbi:unnamed protein product [Heligmosomoides polygyrus]|uniref:Uncharacterized protein n=1 Tax=Heligmosomoides polygyrus TaxID=6339 RepID=A0A183GDD0_HELPZ|nr:unnamed protein product [Heligmosomoides polygyrus]
MECAGEAKKDGLHVSALSNDHPPIPSLKSDFRYRPHRPFDSTPSPIRLSTCGRLHRPFDSQPAADSIVRLTLNLPPSTPLAHYHAVSSSSRRSSTST